MGGKKKVKVGKRKEVQVVERKKSNLPEQIQELEKEISKTKVNKSTERAVGLLKGKLALLKGKNLKRSAKGKGGDDRFSVRKTGDGTVVLLGFPSVGKSTLLNKLTNAKSDIGAYAFTTLSAVPGLMKYKYAQIQIIDVPGVVGGAASGKGRGKEVLTMLRNADLVMILVEAQNLHQYKSLLKEVYDADIRLDQKKPDVVITKKERGGISVSSLVKLTKINKKTIEDIMKMFKMINVDILFREDITLDQFIDVLENNKIYTKSLNVITKIDLVNKLTLKSISEKIKPCVVVSAETGKGIGDLREAIYQKLDLIRIFLKEVGKKPDMEEPLIMFKSCSIRDICEKLHKDFVSNFRFARVWGKSAKFDGQKYNKMDKNLEDKDVLELHIR
ncbi:GTP-binding protein [Candidatus Woesearchaeota archaeon B3_Woes]|nr:MAG: GTP-binding protein [Candidatus Woesearchaeota archaeon B3_Woes]